MGPWDIAGEHWKSAAGSAKNMEIAGNVKVITYHTAKSHAPGVFSVK